jgi:hypothetical protein
LDGPVDLEIRDLDFSYAEDTFALRDVNLRVLDGQAVALLRRAGDGPTTGAAARADGRRGAVRARAARPAPAIEPGEAAQIDVDPIDEDDVEDEREGGTVMPFGIFDARADAPRWL